MQSNIPKCPHCAAIMMVRHQQDNVFYYCQDCFALFRIIGKGQIDNEVVISDEGEKEE